MTELQTPVKRKRGGKIASVEANSAARPEEVAKAIMDNFYYFGRKKVQTDEECAERLNAFFKECYERQAFPTVEKMCLALGTDRKTVWEWEQGIRATSERSHLIKQAKQILAAIDADMAASGKIPQVVYIFRAKNYYGMRDQTELAVNNAGNDVTELSAEDIAKRYLIGE